MTSKPSKDLLELGRHLVEELGHADRGTTLGRWMAHHLARLILEAEEAGPMRKRDSARKAVEKLIIELWAQRTSLPGRADPLARYERALTVIERLSPDDFPWRHHPANTLHGSLAELNDAVSKLVYNTVLREIASDLPPGQFEELALPFLDRVEQKLLNRFGNILIKIVDPAQDGTDAPDMTIDQRLASAQFTSIEKASRALSAFKTHLEESAKSTDERGADENEDV